MPAIFFPTSIVPGYPPEAITTHTAESCDQRKSPSLTRPSIEASMASTKSLSMRIRIGCVSGSPNRQLNSSTIGPRAAIISPQYRIPLYSIPSAFMPSTVGRATCCSSHCVICSSRSPGNEYAPMPPVLGPVSSSPTRLWSCAATRGETRSPSLSTRNESSSPCRHSSITTRAPASPTIFPESISPAAIAASSFVLQITTPLPAASPSAFTTTGALNRESSCFTSELEVQIA